MESHSLLLSVVVLVLIVVVLFTNDANITGFVPSETHIQELGLHVLESQRYALSSTQQILSMSLSGAVEGEGIANVYLSDGYTRKMIFTNAKKQSTSLTHITGLAVSELVIEPTEKLSEHNKVLAGYITQDGAFSSVCTETCSIPKEFKAKYLDVVIDEKTALYISQIIFSTDE